MDISFNIVELIEKNPISKLSNTYNGKLLNNIQCNFTNFEQQLFVASFYCYINCNQKNDFVIDLDNIWKWLGFSQKAPAKYLLEKQFVVDIDYKFIALEHSKANKSMRGGHNKEIIMISVKTFKSLCLKAGTKKADEIHEYYIKMEEIIQHAVQEESDELKIQLKQKDKLLETAERAARKAAEQATIDQFPRNTQCVYIGTTGNVSKSGETLIKFGQTNDLQQRVYNHRGTFADFTLITAYRVQNSTEIENLIRNHAKIKKQIRDVEIDAKTYKEMIAYDENLNIEKITQYVKEIIYSKQYSIDNFNKIIKQFDEQCYQIEKLHEDLKELNNLNIKYANEIERLQQTVNEQSAVIAAVKDEESVAHLYPHQNRFDEFIRNACLVRHDVEESTVNLEGQYRIYCQTKPSKETFHAFKQYLDTRFKPQRLTKQDKSGVVNGYLGVRLNIIDYKKTESSDAENFIFQVCKFSPSGKILNSTLLEEYKRWKTKLDKPITDNEIKELKEYLNTSPHALKSVVWVNNNSNEGYYGVSLKSEDEYMQKKTSSTGKKVEKRLIATDLVIDKWNTIAKAAINENVSAIKMSRMIKNKTEHGEFYYVTV
jgi:hypothetical protein